MVVKRLRDGRAAKAATGRKATGAYPFGYAGAGKGRSRDAAPQDDEQRAVLRILALRAEGRSYRDVADVLHAEGIKPRRAASWSPMTIRGITLREAGVSR